MPEKQILRSEFIEPPFSVLDTKNKYWKERKNKWKEHNINGEIGRGANLLGLNGFNNSGEYEKRKSYKGTSIFDPVLTELMYTWFSDEGDNILDPFAGGLIRGFVAEQTGRLYTGIELRKEQVDNNLEQLSKLNLKLPINYILGDANAELGKMVDNEIVYDMILTCPPYYNLERYSDMDEDLSNMSYDDFIKTYFEIIAKSCSLLKDGGFACMVIGDVRDRNGWYRGLPAKTIEAFNINGVRLYNHAILLENGLNTAAMRARRYMKSRKLVKIHQDVLIFKKPLTTIK